MTSSARDLRYGRRAGRWAHHGSGTLLEELAAAKAAHVRENARRGCTCPLCDPTGHPAIGIERPTSPDGWRAAARMAHARHAAGAHLSDVDREAIRRHPRTPSLLSDGEYGPTVDLDKIPAASTRGAAAPPPLSMGEEEVAEVDPFDQALDGSERAAGRWTKTERDLVDQAIRAVATMLDEFTADDVWTELAGRVPVTKGLTARLMVARRAGLIAQTGRFTVAQRGGDHDHAQRLTVWRSTVHDTALEEAG